MEKQNVALVAGATGIVGEALVELLLKPTTPGSPWKVYGLARRPRHDAGWMPSSVEYVQCDLLDRDDVFSKLAPLTDVTHLFWVTWAPRPTEAENVVENGRAFQNAIDALLSDATNNKLEHIVLQTGLKHYIGSNEAMRAGTVVTPDNPFTEEMGRTPGANFYFELEDILFEAVEKARGKLTWSVHRPGIIFGVTEKTAFNFLSSIIVYGVICKHENLPFRFPGTEEGWNGVWDAGNADLIAEQEIWAATDPRGKNQDFNVMNGDQFRWRRVWKLIAEKLGLEFVPFDGRRVLVSESIKNAASVWDTIVQENGLRKTGVGDVSQLWFLDEWFVRPGDLLDLNKSREHGFFGFRNTEKTIPSFIDKMRERRLIP